MSSPLQDKTVFVLDTHGILHQLFHAMPEMTSPRGEPVGAVFGFARDLITLLSKSQPDYLFCAYDLPGKTFRSTIYPKYKENRKEMPDSLRPQIEISRNVLESFDIPVLSKEGFEADDVLATLAREVEEKGGRCVLVTSDKDARQLITDKVSLYIFRKQQYYTAENLLADWGITPGQVVDFQALTGDASDNVPGVPLIGPKIATELITKYGTLENVLDHAHEMSGAKRKQNLLEGRDIALMSRELVALRKDVPLDIPWEQGKYDGIDAGALRELFRRYGFNSLLSRFEDVIRTLRIREGSNVTETPKKSASGTLFDLDGDDNDNDNGNKKAETPNTNFLEDNDGFADEVFSSAGAPAVKAKYHLVDNPELFERFREKLAQQKCFSCDTETTDVRPRFAKLVGLSFCWSEDEAWYLPLRGPLGAETLEEKTTLASLKPIFENPGIGKIGQNLKYDQIVLRNYEIALRGIRFDTMIADYLLRAGEQNHNLDFLAELYLGHKTQKISELIGTGKKQKRMDEVPCEHVCDYAGEDALIPWLLRPLLEEKLQKYPKIKSLYDDWELPLLDVLAEMEFTGIMIDVSVLKELSGRFASRLEELQTEIYDIAGTEFNIASPKQLQQILFEQLKLPVLKKTKTGASTDIEVLEELALQHELPRKIIEHRQLSKLKGTYVDALPEMVHPLTGRIHASFNQVVTATGRLSSSDPNLQNIPIRMKEGKEIRSAFTSDKKSGYDFLLSCDYSQIELRVLAHFSEDENLTRAFASGEDIHAGVASEVFGVPLGEVNAEMRRKAKAVNFGVIYGQSAFGLAKQLGITQDEAAEFIDAYFNKFGGIRAYLEEILESCYRNGYVSTLLGRRRRIAGVRSARKSGQMILPERTAVNTVIQGSAADLMKQAMLRLDRKLRDEKKYRANMLLQIHDELVFEVAASDLKALKETVVTEMLLEQPLRVPLIVDAESGPRWG